MPNFTYFNTLFLCVWLQVINKVKFIHQRECHIKVKVKYLHPFNFYVAHTFCKRVVCIRLNTFLFYLFLKLCHFSKQTFIIVAFILNILTTIGTFDAMFVQQIVKEKKKIQLWGNLGLYISRACLSVKICSPCILY